MWLPTHARRFHSLSIFGSADRVATNWIGEQVWSPVVACGEAKIGRFYGKDQLTYGTTEIGRILEAIQFKPSFKEISLHQKAVQFDGQLREDWDAQ